VSPDKESLLLVPLINDMGSFLCKIGV
jgi:hypothetical protein